MSSYNIIEDLKIDHKTVKPIYKKGYPNEKLDITVPHELTERSVIGHALIGNSHLNVIKVKRKVG